MKQLVIISGKGGTGKTVLSGVFASVLKSLNENVVLVDCDVDAANLHLLLHPTIKETHAFQGGSKAVIDPKKCVHCGLCETVCRFEAIHQYPTTHELCVDPIACEGCGFCSHVCPVQAISMQKHTDGEWFISDTRYGTFVHAQLGIGEGNSGKLVSHIRQQAETLAQKQNAHWIIIDGPPGIGCPTTAALTHTDIAVIVTEPTLSGIHDLQRVILLIKRFHVIPYIIVNKYDLNMENTQKIKKISMDAQIPCVGEIPYTEAIPLAITHGKIITESGTHSEIATIFRKIIFTIIQHHQE